MERIEFAVWFFVERASWGNGAIHFVIHSLDCLQPVDLFLI